MVARIHHQAGGGVKESVFIVAEAGVNHNGSLEWAKKMVAFAGACGCDAVKFQTFRAERIVSAGAPKCSYQIETTGEEESQLEMIRRLELDEAAHRELIRVAGEEGVDFISTPFDEESATLLASLGVKRIKVPSGEITNLPFLVHVARLRKPILLSTGMAYLSEIDEAVRAIKENSPLRHAQDSLPFLTLLHCLTQYPAPVEEVNLRCMLTLREAFKLPVGYSDHTLGIEVPMAAVALGATVIEKHFTLDRTLPGPDHRASLEPTELKKMVQGIRNIEASLGDGWKTPSASEFENRERVRKGLVAAKDLKAGHRLGPEDITAKRPAKGISPGQKPLVIGSILQRDIEQDTPITWEHLLRR
jgi:N-acetylneuraminate synthase